MNPRRRVWLNNNKSNVKKSINYTLCLKSRVVQARYPNLVSSNPSPCVEVQ